MTDRRFAAAYVAIMLTVGLPFAVVAAIVFGAGLLGLWLVRRCVR